MKSFVITISTLLFVGQVLASRGEGRSSSDNETKGGKRNGKICKLDARISEGFSTVNYLGEHP